MRLSSWELWRKGGEAAWVPRSLQNQTFCFLLEQYSCSLSLRQDYCHDKEQRDGDYFEDNDVGDTDDNDVGSIRQFLEASDNFCVLRRQQRGSDTRSWPALHGQVALFSYLSHFMVLVFSGAFCVWNEAENLFRPTVLENILNDLFHVFRYETCSNLRQVKRHLISS